MQSRGIHVFHCFLMSRCKFKYINYVRRTYRFLVQANAKHIILLVIPIKKLELIMPRSQRNDNSIDKPSTILAYILIQVLPTTKRETKASTYNRDGAIRYGKSILMDI